MPSSRSAITEAPFVSPFSIALAPAWRLRINSSDKGSRHSVFANGRESGPTSSYSRFKTPTFIISFPLEKYPPPQLTPNKGLNPYLSRSRNATRKPRSNQTKRKSSLKGKRRQKRLPSQHLPRLHGYLELGLLKTSLSAASQYIVIKLDLIHYLFSPRGAVSLCL
jgi:hypothetical protein